MTPFLALLLFASLGATTILGGIIWGGRCNRCNDCCCDGDCEGEI